MEIVRKMSYMHIYIINFERVQSILLLLNFFFVCVCVCGL